MQNKIIVIIKYLFDVVYLDMLVALYHSTMCRNIWTGEGQTGSSANTPDSIQNPYGIYFYTTTMTHQLNLHMDRILFRIPIQNLSWVLVWPELCGVTSLEGLTHTHPAFRVAWPNVWTNDLFWMPHIW